MNSLLLLVALTVTSVLSYKTFNEDLAKKINGLQNTWKARPNHMTRKSIGDIKKMMGARLERTRNLPVKPQERTLFWDIPDTFDARVAWPKCSTINSIKDQSNCGSCWAVSAASCMSDRLCIATNGRINVNISAEQLVSCCHYCGDGCDGGYPEEAWAYAQRTGVVTGGDYGSRVGCQPYEVPPCHKSKCSADVDTPSCHRSCTNKLYGQSFSSDLHKFKSPYRISSSVASIQAEILEHGPVEAGFTVYLDFNYYNRGVYRYIHGREIGGHAVRIIGWGTQLGVDYWLCANSWTRAWGENGFFKIARGTNECGIEESVVAGLPSV